MSRNYGYPGPDYGINQAVEQSQSVGQSCTINSWGLTVFADASIGDIDLVLPATGGSKSLAISVIKTDGTSNIITISGLNQIKTSASTVLTTQYQVLTFIVDTDTSCICLNNREISGIGRSLQDGNYGDIIVSEGGTVWSVTDKIATKSFVQSHSTPYDKNQLLTGTGSINNWFSFVRINSESPADITIPDVTAGSQYMKIYNQGPGTATFVLDGVLVVDGLPSTLTTGQAVIIQSCAAHHAYTLSIKSE